MNYKQLLTVLAWAALLPAGAALGHDGEDHSEAPPAPAATGAGPRIEAHSDLFELVGRVEHGVMTIWLDRYADNAPVNNARIEVESGNTRGVASANKDGSYSFKSPLFDKPAALSLTFTVSAGGDDDLLAGDLLLAPADSHDEGHDHPAAGPGPWSSWSPLRIALTLALVLLVTFGARFGLRAHRNRNKEST